MPRKLPRIEPELKYDFILHISKEYDELKKQKFLKFLFETTQHFLAFNYELDVRVSVGDKKITFKIQGFKPPSSPVSRPGPARFEYNFYNYTDGVYTLTIVKKENLKNIFSILISGDKISVENEPRKNKFVKLNIIER
ncbi:hypothetical protein [Candidatus Kryptobacter tengchongensis]|uniref:Uncharacterized protein n=1 Tax=Kryptobacter tengchongensis TaxID=1643429 RepID=A0A656D226_KRYT1|nr:hypothetical protein [Candidatus Kryptobacter tengchongensis]CUS96940.1 hypothetical protein JGI24_00196 [Candidatus Kryptobacter tengchongensis]